MTVKELKAFLDEFCTGEEDVIIEFFIENGKPKEMKACGITRRIIRHEWIIRHECLASTEKDIVITTI